MDASDQLSARLDKLERQNRNLKQAGLVVCGLATVLIITAWRSPHNESFDSLTVGKLEVIDAKGIPVIALSPNRANTGGTIVLRDNSGDKRSWWETDAGSARIVFESPNGKNDERTIAGLSTTPGKAQMSLLGSKGDSILDSVENDRPTVTLQDAHGKSLFAAPWHG
jgi:hypothetical protein